MINEMIERVAAAIALGVCKSCQRPCVGHGGGRTPDCDRSDCEWRPAGDREQARAAIEAMRELPSEPGPRYTAGEYSRRTQVAMVDDALGASYISDLMPVYGSREVEEK